jgi:peptide chain release factor subunit 3
MGDSWEDLEVKKTEDNLKPKGTGSGFKMSANAPTFSFNPTASSFTPGGPKPAAPAAAVATKVAEVATPEAEVEAAAGSPPTPQPEKVAAAPKAAAPTPTKASPKPAPAKAKAKSGGKGKNAKGGDAEAEKKMLEEFKALGHQKDHVNAVFIGHVDAGKSTLGGQILFLTGNVDDRTIEKYEREAKEKNRDSWYMAYIMDTNDEERDKGKTVEVGRANFESDKKRYTILDAPGHKNYVPNMIGGASQADIGVLVIAARKGEFETGFDRGGQTREHAQLAKTLGVSKLIVVVNKMDDPSISEGGKWSKERYDEILGKLTPFLKTCGYNLKKDVLFVPISALTGGNIRDPISKEHCSWWTGGTLFETLDNLQPIDRLDSKPFRMPVMDKYSDGGAMVMGKIESGVCKVGADLVMMPNGSPCKVQQCFRDENEIEICGPGENLRVKLTGIDEKEIQPGFVLCSAVEPIYVVNKFEAQIATLELLEHKAIFTAGYKAVVHLHSIIEECEILSLVYEIDPRTKEKKKTKFVKSGKLVVCRLQTVRPIPLERFSDVPQLGRFTLRDEGKTIAIGKVTKLPRSQVE